MGTPLTGRGIIQIWCMLNVGMNEEESPQSKKKPKRISQNTEAIEDNPTKRPRGRPRKNPTDQSQPDQVKRPKGRPRKKSTDESLNSDQNDQSFQPLSVQYPESSLEPVSLDSVPGNKRENSSGKDHHRKQRGEKEAAFTSDAMPKTSKSRKLKSKVPEKTESDGKCLQETASSTVNQQIQYNPGQDAIAYNVFDSNPVNVSPCSSPIPGDITLPRAVLCLAHMGKVAWDVKWQPYDINDSKCKQWMGYLAVLLGNGSLEV